MNPKRTILPLVEPVTLTELKAHLRIDHADEDSYITNLITAARELVESYLKKALIAQTYVWTLNSWRLDIDPSGKRFIELPVGPLLAITSINTYGENDNATLWAADQYYAAKSQNRLYARAGVSWPDVTRVAEGIEIAYQAGFGANASDVPQGVKQALMQLAAHLYDTRTAVNQSPLKPIPLSVLDLLTPYRKRRL